MPWIFPIAVVFLLFLNASLCAHAEVGVPALTLQPNQDEILCGAPAPADAPSPAAMQSPVQAPLQSPAPMPTQPAGKPAPVNAACQFAGLAQPATQAAAAKEAGSRSAIAPSSGEPDSPGFAYYPPGELLPQDSARGRKNDRFIYLKDILFPLQLGPSLHPHMNSQIYGYGGSGWDGKYVAGGQECDLRNYDPMKQRDTYCEVRSKDRTHAMPLCPLGYGHQGQDIRPPDCAHHTWEAVAVADGRITQITGFSYLTLLGNDGTQYAYLHMDPKSVKVKKGDLVKQGDVLGYVGNVMDYQTGGTTYHLHFQVLQNIKAGAKVMRVYVPVYASLIAAYRKSKGLGAGIDSSNNLAVDPKLEIGVQQVSVPAASAKQ